VKIKATEKDDMDEDTKSESFVSGTVRSDNLSLAADQNAPYILHAG
jgi:hypothetical protein